MDTTQQIPNDTLEAKAIEVLKQNPEPVRGPRTIGGKINSLKNLKKRFPAPNSVEMDSDIFYSSSYLTTTQTKNCKDNITDSQKGFYESRYEYFVKNTKVVNVLNEFLIKSIILSEIEIQKYFHFLNDPDADINKKIKVQKMLKSMTTTYAHYFKLLAPHQRNQRTLHYSMITIMEEFDKEYEAKKRK